MSKEFWMRLVAASEAPFFKSAETGAEVARYELESLPEKRTAREPKVRPKKGPGATDRACVVRNVK